MKLNVINSIALLNAIGYNMGELRKKQLGELKDMLNYEETINKSRYDKFYAVIIDHVFPDEDADKDLLLYHKVGELLQEHVDRITEAKERQFRQKIDYIERASETAIEKINAEIDNSKPEVRIMIYDLLEEAKKKAIEEAKVIKIKVGNHKAKKLDGVIPEYFETLLKKAQARLNIMLVGPAGSGKTYIAGMVAKALDLDFASQSCTAGMSESALSGWLIPTGDNGKFVYVSSEFIRIYENGGVFLFDEMDAADPNVLIFINQAIANGGFSLPIRYENPTVKKHKDFVCIAATNTFGGGADSMYHARNALDGATLDRFKVGMIKVDYSERVEETLVDPEVYIWCKMMREKIDKYNLKRIMSTRVMLDMTKLKQEQDFNMEQLSNDYLLDWSKEECLVVGV